MKKKPSKHGLMGYRIVYTDQKEENKKKNIDYGIILYSAKYDIQGKPDYIFQRYFGKALVPIEIKSGQIGDSKVPHKGDMLQLAAYFLIIEDVYKRKPKYGRLVYKDHMFIIRNTFRIRQEVLNTISRMRNMLEGSEEKANPSFITCRHCVCNGTVCKYCNTNKNK